MDASIEETVRACSVCKEMRNEPPKAQVHTWNFPLRPWYRIHIDFAGPVDGKMYLIVVDAHSKFPEVLKISSTNTSATLIVLRDSFGRNGLPEILVSDNGPQFRPQEFETIVTQVATFM